MGLRCWNSDLKAESGRSARHRSVRLFHLAIRALFCLERMIVPNACFQSRKHTHMLARTETAREVFLLWWKAGVGFKKTKGAINNFLSKLGECAVDGGFLEVVQRQDRTQHRELAARGRSTLWPVPGPGVATGLISEQPTI